MTTRSVKSLIYVVTAPRGRFFPMDMLRYAESYPFSSADAAVIEKMISSDGRETLPKTVAIQLVTDTDPYNARYFLESTSAKRWESFGFKVLVGSDASEAIYDFSQAKEAVAETARSAT